MSNEPTMPDDQEPEVQHEGCNVSVFESWQELPPSDWHGAVFSIASAAVERHPIMKEIQRARTEGAAKSALDRGMLRYEEATFGIAFASAMGVALARTWPDGPEALDEWADRAWEYGKLDRIEASPSFMDKLRAEGRLPG